MMSHDQALDKIACEKHTLFQVVYTEIHLMLFSAKSCQINECDKWNYNMETS